MTAAVAIVLVVAAALMTMEVPMPAASAPALVLVPIVVLRRWWRGGWFTLGSGWWSRSLSGRRVRRPFAIRYRWSRRWSAARGRLRRFHVDRRIGRLAFFNVAIGAGVRIWIG
jgi:hypothetical protein